MWSVSLRWQSGGQHSANSVNDNHSIMLIIILLISISLAIASGFLIGFVWAMRSGQYDDTWGPAVRILFDSKKKGE